ncbi:Putative phage integrase [Burkholderia sp. GAS332]|nr:Putative phage integrase [Burkholderia sp. GAS332]
MSKAISPNIILQQLLDATQRQSRKDKLSALHELCSNRLAAGEHDFSIGTIAKLCTAVGLMSGRVLSNPVGAAPYRKLIAAWAVYSEEKSLGPFDGAPTTHPDSVVRKLIQKSPNSIRKRNLRNVHELCRKHHATGSLDFSIRTVGALCEERGILNAHSLSDKDFSDFRVLIDSWDALARPWLMTDAEVDDKTKRAQKQHDLELQWVARDYPEFSHWRERAVEWLQGESTGLNHKLAAFSNFFKKYLTRPDVPTDLREFLARGCSLPDFRETACPPTAGVVYGNSVSAFLDWILLRDFSDVTDDGIRVVSPAFRNPIQPVSKSGVPVHDDSVRSPLPYGYLDELRHLLAQGAAFRDWTFAHNALGVTMGEKGAPGRDWFDVPEHLIDREDPDCVWRIRDGRTQLWSPVRWLAVHIKLLLPLRTTQVRMLDSGESDTWRYDSGAWTLNEGPLAAGVDKAWRQGVLRRNPDPLDGSIVSTTLYINTNKTADVGKDGVAKGYVLPWFDAPNLAENVFYWLEKLRNWQAKYNPVDRRTSWSELDARHIAVKSESQLASYPDACFLFRLAEGDVSERHLPVSDGILTSAWCRILEELQDRLASRGETHADGSPVQFATRDEGRRTKTDFPLHSLRVSLVTALALEGGVPFPILQKLVGHSRLLMTLYYVKPGAARINTMLTEAAAKMDAGKERSISEYLLNTEHERLVESAVCNSPSSLAAAIPEHPAARNPAGWMPMHHGLCLVGGNTSELEDNRKIGGCHNGGPNVGTEGRPAYGPVPGGSRNCVRCRWFVTEPHHLPALAAHFNTIAYHFDEARNKSMSAEHELQDLKRLKAKMETHPEDGPFTRQPELRQAERRWEASMKRFSDLAEDLVACWRLVERCQSVLVQSQEGQQLLTQGTVLDVQSIFEETESELLQLSGVCESLELYPDLEAGKAIIRRSQLLDSAVYNEGLSPVFMQLSEREQLLAGNAFLRRLASHVNPANPALAQRQVIELMDAGKRLGEHLGIELGDSLPPVSTARVLHALAIPTTRISDATTV